MAFLRFPLGGLAKAETRAHAERLGLSIANKPDSQDICFVPSGSYAEVVSRLRPEAALPGDIVDEAGTVLGQHEGVTRFTVGQRRGLDLGGRPEPLYVLHVDAERRQVVVGPRERLALHEVRLRDCSWLADPSTIDRVQVKLRSAQPPAEAQLLILQDGRALVRMTEAVISPAPGQACVCYDGDRLLGGGVIDCWQAASTLADAA